jgi:hypothetical protein
MARYSRKAILHAREKIVDRRPGAVDEDGKEITVKVAFDVRVHENESTAVLHTSGWGVGRHQGSVRFDVGDDTFNRAKFLDWDGAETSVELEFVPVAAIAVIDGSDEIRF